MEKHRYVVYPVNDYEVAKLWVFANENQFIVFPSIQRYLEFKFIYKGLIVDLDHRTVQMDGAEVAGGWNAKTIGSIFDLIKIYNDSNKLLHLNHESIDPNSDTGPL